MKVVTEYLHLSTKGDIDIVNITDHVAGALRKTKLRNGIVNLCSMGSTAAITTCEDETGLLSDLKTIIEKLVPRHKGYEHDRTLDEGNAHSHLRASLIGSTITIPFNNGNLKLG